ncbi:MAG: acetyl-CoA/propionyl-CoA carboxylase carboxyl transferase subunit, partial [Kribbellaceae bacterium]|nr:acetyl-CoA/propionyl-CoA carboxylase carboxyl transferase subunit [Kribbellaceae bacterium]
MTTAPVKPVKLPREEDPRNPVSRLTALFDPGTLELITPDNLSGMLAARGTIAGAAVIAFCSDATVMGGAMGDEGCEVVVQAYHVAREEELPIIGLWHSGGARLAEGVLSLHAVGKIFFEMTQASGKIPQISVVVGPAAGGAAYGPALTDIVILGPEGRIFVTGPDVVRSVTGEDVDMLRLGGPEPHGRRSGVVHITTDSEAAAIEKARRLADLLANPGSVSGEVADTDLSGFLPESAKRAYDVHPLVGGVLDEES